MTVGFSLGFVFFGARESRRSPVLTGIGGMSQ